MYYVCAENETYLSLLLRIYDLIHTTNGLANIGITALSRQSKFILLAG